ncbi:MAG: hypothetical protein SynsKO_28820 [Synoicihabitans sp.]
MRRATTALTVLGGLALATIATAQQSLENFDSVSTRDIYFAGTWEASGSVTGTQSPAASLLQGSGVYDVAGTGVTNDADSFFEVHFSSSPLDLSALDAILVTGSALEGNEATSLEVRLFDTAGASAYAVVELSALGSPAVWQAGENFAANTVEIVRVSGGQLAGTAAFAVQFDEIQAVDSTVQVDFHDADTDRDMAIGLSELLRVIELYNTRFGTTRTGRYTANAETVDGFAPDTSVESGTTPTFTRFHTGDYDRDAQFSLAELLRIIEIYNTREGTTRTGQYRRDAESVDGFAPGPEPSAEG